MLIVLIIANLALTVGLMTMVKETKKINKEIEDIGFNIAHIQRNVTELGYSSTFANKSISELHNRVENNTEILGNSILEEIKTNTGQINETIISNKDEITKEFRQIHKEALGYPPALVLLKK